MATMVIMILMVTMSRTSVCVEDDDDFIIIDVHDDYEEYDVNDDSDIGGKV